MAGRIGISGQSVSKWEKGECLPDVWNLMLLARLFRVSIDSLLLAESRCAMGFVRETTMDSQPAGVDVYKMPASLYIRAYADGAAFIQGKMRGMGAFRIYSEFFHACAGLSNGGEWRTGDGGFRHGCARIGLCVYADHAYINRISFIRPPFRGKPPRKGGLCMNQYVLWKVQYFIGFRMSFCVNPRPAYIRQCLTVHNPKFRIGYSRCPSLCFHSPSAAGWCACRCCAFPGVRRSIYLSPAWFPITYQTESYRNPHILNLPIAYFHYGGYNQHKRGEHIPHL